MVSAFVRGLRDPPDALNFVDVYPSGNYTYAKGCIRFRRLPSQYFYQIAMAIIFVWLSYLGFWIDPLALRAHLEGLPQECTCTTLASVRSRAWEPGSARPA